MKGGSAFVISEPTSFPALLVSPSRLAGLFLAGVQEAEGRLGRRDYQLSVVPRGVSSELLCRLARRSRPDCRRGGVCATCHPEKSVAALFGMGEEGETSGLGKVAAATLRVEGGGGEGTVWVDAKRRPVLVCTPGRHVERLGELERGEAEKTLETLARALERFEGAAEEASRLVLNMGSCQNHPHLHWKLYMTERAFGDTVIARLSQQQRTDLEEVEKGLRQAKKKGWVKRK